MGFAPVASTGILLIAIFQILGGTVPSVLEAREAVDAARDDAWDRVELRDNMDADISAVSFGASLTEFTATNTGDVRINLRQVLLVLDGTPYAPDAWNVGGLTTDIWLPGETATFQLNNGTFSTAALALPTGELIHWRP